MIRLSANLSKKVPVQGVEFSSQQYGASLEIEVSDTDKPETIRGRIQELYRLLNQSVDEQIASASKGAIVVTNNAGQPAPVSENTTPRWKQNGSNGKNGNGHQPVPATAAQVKAIGAICSKLGIELSEVLAEYKVQDAKDLTVRQASKAIDDLKKEQSTRR